MNYHSWFLSFWETDHDKKKSVMSCRASTWWLMAHMKMNFPGFLFLPTRLRGKIFIKLFKKTKQNKNQVFPYAQMFISLNNMLK